MFLARARVPHAGLYRHLTARIATNRGFAESSHLSSTQKAVRRFIYPKLDQDRQIRLLQVLPDKGTHRMLAKLTHVLLDDLLTPYTAISYCWGDSTPVNKVWCSEDEYLEVSESAADILRTIIAKKYPGYFWIDALCIDQGNTAEKEKQVRLMRDIFASADEVMGWLGKPSDDSDVAIRFIRTLNHTIEEIHLVKKTVSFSSVTESPNCHVSSPNWKALSHLLFRPWFLRVWVVQEVVVANNVIVMCGDERVRWVVLARVIAAISRNGLSKLVIRGAGFSEDVPKGLSGPKVAHKIKVDRDNGQPVRLQLQLLDTGIFEATDTRDKLHALLGIVTDGNDSELDPDYESTVQDVYRKSSEFLMSRDRSLEILHVAGIGFPRSIPNLPSWVPDWSKFEMRAVFGANAPFSGYRAAGTSPVEIDDGKRSKKENELILTGRIIDNIVMALPFYPFELWYNPFGPLGDRHRIRREALGWLAETARRVSIPAPYITGENWRDVFWRTLFANMPLLEGPGYAVYEYRHDFECFWSSRKLDYHKNANEKSTRDMPDVWNGSQRFAEAWMSPFRRRFFTTKLGYLGLGPQNIEDGDEICIIHGATTPFIIRKNFAQRAERV